MSMVAAVSNRGLMRFKLYEDALNGAIFIDFMTRLVRDARQKVFLIVGDTRIHLASFDKNSGAVQEWLAHQGRDRDFHSSGRCAGTHLG
jgi:hypothetical protein